MLKVTRPTATEEKSTMTESEAKRALTWAVQNSASEDEIRRLQRQIRTSRKLDAERAEDAAERHEIELDTARARDLAARIEAGKKADAAEAIVRESTNAMTVTITFNKLKVVVRPGAVGDAMTRLQIVEALRRALAYLGQQQEIMVGTARAVAAGRTPATPKTAAQMRDWLADDCRHGIRHGAVEITLEKK